MGNIQLYRLVEYNTNGTTEEQQALEAIELARALADTACLMQQNVVQGFVVYRADGREMMRGGRLPAEAIN